MRLNFSSPSRIRFDFAVESISAGKARVELRDGAHTLTLELSLEQLDELEDTCRLARQAIQNGQAEMLKSAAEKITFWGTPT